jgi:transposase
MTVGNGGNGRAMAWARRAAEAEVRVERPNPEVLAKARRRRFTAAYKLRIVQEADGCRKDGEIGALLRREGLYSSQLATWRRQRAEGLLSSVTARRRGRPAASALQAETSRLRAENEQLLRKLAVAETVIEIQKKVSTLLGLTLPIVPSDVTP